MPASNLGVSLNRVPELRAHLPPPPPTAEIVYPDAQRVDVTTNERLNKIVGVAVLCITVIDAYYMVSQGIS